MGRRARVDAASTLLSATSRLVSHASSLGTRFRVEAVPWCFFSLTASALGGTADALGCEMHRPPIHTSRRSEVSPRKLVLASLLATSAFVALSAMVEGGGTKHVDRAVRSRLHPRRRPRVRRAASIITNIAAPHTHPILSVALAIIASRRTRRIAYGIPAASVGAAVVDKTVRLIVRQKRPPLAGVHRGLDRYAFPSGHTCAATAIAVAFASHVWPTLTDVQRRATAAVAVTLPLGIAWTRVYLDEHWIDDIVGGWLAGVAVGCIASA